MNLDPGKIDFSEQDHEALRGAVETVKRTGGLTEAAIAREADIGAPVLNSYLKGTYGGRNDQVAIKLNRWLEARKKAATLRRRLPQAPAFVPLSASRTIEQRFYYARAMGRMVMVTGVPGCSKTSTARQFCQDNPRSWLVPMDPSTRGVPTMLLTVLAAMGITDVSGTPMQLANRVVAKATEAEALLLIDEAQHLSEQAIEQLRAINDRTRAMGQPLGIALIGNEEANTKIGPTGHKPAFAQVSSRIAQRKYLAAPNPDDVATLARAWAAANDEVVTPEDIAFLVEIAMRPGGLRNVEMTFEGALIAAWGAGEPLELKHLKGAFNAITDIRAA